MMVTNMSTAHALNVILSARHALMQEIIATLVMLALISPIFQQVEMLQLVNHASAQMVPSQMAN